MAGLDCNLEQVKRGIAYLLGWRLDISTPSDN